MGYTDNRHDDTGSGNPGAPPPVPGYDPSSGGTAAPATPSNPNTPSDAGQAASGGGGYMDAQGMYHPAPGQGLGDNPLTGKPYTDAEAKRLGMLAAESVGGSSGGGGGSGTGGGGGGGGGGGAGGGGTSTTDINSSGSMSSSSVATNTTHTAYTSYLDPASIQGAQADAWYRLLGRNPTSAEYQAFMQTVYKYEDDANSGTFESGIVLKDGQRFDKTSQQVVDVKTGKPVSQSDILRTTTGSSDSTSNTMTDTNVVTQRGLGTRGLEFLAGQAAMQNPEEAVYQAATTYFNAFMKALSGPAAGMQSSGPTSMAP